MSFKIEMEFDDLPKTMNQLLSKHWRVRQGEKVKWHRRIIERVNIFRLKPPKPLARAQLKLTRYSSKDIDYDNLASSFKYCTDALIAAGVIEDDKMSVIGMPDIGWIKVAPNKGKIRIEVREI